MGTVQSKLRSCLDLRPTNFCQKVKNPFLLSRHDTPTVLKSYFHVLNVPKAGNVSSSPSPPNRNSSNNNNNNEAQERMSK